MAEEYGADQPDGGQGQGLAWGTVQAGALVRVLRRVRIWARLFWRQVGATRAGMDLATLAGIGVASYLGLRAGSGLQPVEGAFLMVVAAGLITLGRWWWDWQRRLIHDSFLDDWARRTLDGERAPMVLPPGLDQRDQRVFAALNRVIGEVRSLEEDLAQLRQAATREWRDLDGLLESIERGHAMEREVSTQGMARLQAFGRDLKVALEDTLKLDQLELNHRLQADQHRLQGHAFRAILGQMHTSLEMFDELIQELQDSFPRLRREEDAMGRLADAGVRQGARLSLSVKGLVAHTPRLVEETQTRLEWLQRFRLSADGVRDQAEALARRIESFREDAQLRIRSFAGAQGTLKGLDQIAQQTSLLAVNAAIIAQQEGGSAGMAAIGVKLRSLADQTADGASNLERSLNQHHQGLERETTGLWDLQEATERLMSGMHELLRMAGHLDQQNHDLERALETHLGLVDQVRQVSERAELSLHEVSERVLGLEAAHGRQWGVEAKLLPERHRLVRVGARLDEVGEELARTSQRSIDEVWDLLTRHQEIRRTEAYRVVASEGETALFPESARPETAWSRIAWTRAQRRPRLAQKPDEVHPLRQVLPDGTIHLLLLGQDALALPEPSALQAWDCDATGRIWHLHLLPSLRTEEHRLALLETLRESPLAACLPGVDLRISAEGVEVTLATPYPGFPDFLTGLGLKLPVLSADWDGPTRAWVPPVQLAQRLLWIGPGADGSRQHPCMRLVHDWLRDDHDHEAFLPGLPYEGHRPPCPMLQDHDVPHRLEAPLPLKLLGLGADASVLHPMRDRLLEAGAVEGEGEGATLCVIGVGHAHPEALLLRLFQPDAGMAGAFHPELVAYQARLRDEVLSGTSADPYRAAWAILEDLQREGWVMPLPSR